jgi:hypothetical protein
MGQAPGPILNQARGWLWQQWWLEKPSYLKVTLHAREGDQTTTEFFICKTGERLDVLIHTHRIATDRAPHPGVRLPVVEDEIELAAGVERRWALANNPDRKTEVPENQEASPDTYELCFMDEAGSTVDVL